MSKKHEKATTFVTYLVGWIMLVELVFVIPLISSPTNEYLALAISVFYAIALIWVYLGERIGKSTTISWLYKRQKVLSLIGFVTACTNLPLSLYILYESGYLLGSYDILSLWAKDMNIPGPDWLPSINRATISSLVGVALSVIFIAIGMYRHGREGSRFHRRVSDAKLSEIEY